MKLLKSTRFWLGVGFLGLIIALRYSGLGDYITLEMVQEKRFQLEQLIANHYLWSVIGYILFYILAVIFALPIVALCTVAGGFFFGLIPAVIYSNIGATIGATIFFLLVRYFFGDLFQERYKNHLVWFNDQIKNYGVYYLIFMRFVAFIPFFVENLVAGLSKAPALTFAWTTAVGIIPGSFVYAFAGRQLATIDSIQDIFSWKILVAFSLLALLALAPIVVRRFRLFGAR